MTCFYQTYPAEKNEDILKKSSILEEQPFSQQPFSQQRFPAAFSAAFLSSPSQQLFLSSVSQQLFSAAFLSSSSQQLFSAALLELSSCCGQGLVVSTNGRK